MRFALEEQQFHRQMKMPFLPLMRSISKYLQVNLRKSRRNGREYCIVESSSPKKLERLVRYLERYPVFTAKENDLRDWLLILPMMERGEHLTNWAISEILEFKKRINSNPHSPIWNHLE